MEMPRSITFKKRYFVPSFRQLVKPLTHILPNTPRLDSRGNRPLQMDFEDQLNALIFFHLEEHTSAGISFRLCRKMILPAITLPRRTALVEIRSLKQLMSGGLNSFSMFFSNCKNKPALFCLNNTPNLATSSLLMDR